MKKRRMVALFLTLVMVASLMIGCQKVNEVEQTEPSEISQGEEENQNETGKKVAFVTAQRLGDEGPVDMVYRGVEPACEEAGLQVHVVEAKKGEYEESMQAMIAEGYDLIVAVFPELLDSVKM